MTGSTASDGLHVCNSIQQDLSKCQVLHLLMWSHVQYYQSWHSLRHPCGRTFLIRNADAEPSAATVCTTTCSSLSSYPPTIRAPKDCKHTRYTTHQHHSPSSPHSHPNIHLRANPQQPNRRLGANTTRSAPGVTHARTAPIPRSTRSLARGDLKPVRSLRLPVVNKQLQWKALLVRPLRQACSNMT